MYAIKLIHDWYLILYISLESFALSFAFAISWQILNVEDTFDLLSYTKIEWFCQYLHVLCRFTSTILHTQS